MFLWSISSALLSCQNDAVPSQSVDSWFVIKEPKGARYVYYDDNTSLSLSSNLLNDTSVGALASTVAALWLPDTEYILFNDEPPVGNRNNATVGHTKGMWAWNGNDAIVLTHSIPIFPSGPSLVPSYQGLGPNAYTFGQSLACFSFQLSTLTEMALQMSLTIPNIYDKKTSVKTPLALQNLANGFVSKDPVCNSTHIQTKNGQPVIYFSKSTAWNDELYSECIAPTVQESLFAETWIRGSAIGPSCQGTYHVNDILSLQLPINDTYKETQDHSKWAIGKSYVCISDINRMTTQFKRGGGAFCFKNVNLAYVLNSTIRTSNHC
jgi:deoxyribonuclease-2